MRLPVVECFALAMGRLSRRLKGIGVAILKRMPPLPGPVWDAFVHLRCGSTAVANPQVLHVPLDGSLPSRVDIEKLPPKPAGSVRIIIVSDTHERHRLVALPNEGDVLLHCGDILMSSSLAAWSRGKRVLNDFNDWLGSLPFPEKVVIGGNHDAALQELGGDARRRVSSAYLLQDSSIVLPASGLKVYGHGYSRGHSHNTAWQEPPSVSEEECRNADVVMTHYVTTEIQEAVLAHAAPRLWASGHSHGDHGASRREGVLYVNASIMDGSYQPTQAPVVVDVPTEPTGREPSCERVDLLQRVASRFTAPFQTGSS